MKAKYLLLLPVLILSACQEKAVVQDNAHYAFFMWNYPRMSAETPNGFIETADNMVYEKKVIEIGQTFTAPTKDPERANYEFQGWFKEKSCENLWNFASDIPEHSKRFFRTVTPETPDGAYHPLGRSTSSQGFSTE